MQAPLWISSELEQKNLQLLQLTTSTSTGLVFAKDGPFVSRERGEGNKKPAIVLGTQYD